MLKTKLKNSSDKIDKAQWQQYLNETKGLERDYMAEIVQSRLIWQIVAMLSLMAFVFSVVFHQMRPVTVKEPFVLRVNDTTGAVQEVSTIKDPEKTYGEVVDRYFAAEFVRSYENYNYQSIQNDYDKTILMSGDTVANDYKKIYTDTPEHPARDKQLGQQGTRKVKILSVVPDIKKGIATVRFQTETTGGNQSTVVENWVATITYEYVSAKIDDSVRLLNPLGYVVTSYRADKEITQ